MTIINKPFWIHAGERKNLEVNVEDVADLSNFSSSFFLFENTDTKEVIFTKPGTAAGNVITISLVKTDTENLKGNYYYRVKIVDGLGEFSFVAEGKMDVVY